MKAGEVVKLLQMRRPSWLDGGLRPRAEMTRDRRDRASIENIDANATAGAAADQSAQDAAARKQRSPAEQGGQG